MIAIRGRKVQKRAQITQENAACLEAEFIRQDAALNKAWKAALARLPAATHTPLLTAQRQWIAARDPFCRADKVGLCFQPAVLRWRQMEAFTNLLLEFLERSVGVAYNLQASASSLKLPELTSKRSCAPRN